MRAAVTVQKNVRSVLNRKLVRVALQGKQGRAEHFASTRIAVKWRVFRAKQDVARRRAERETEARVQAEEGYGEARTALAIEAAAELLSAVARLQVGGRSGCSRMYTAAYTHRMACSMSMCTHQVGESERLVDIAGRPAACILRRAGHYLVMNDNERLPERKVAFDKVAGLCSQFRLEGGEAGEAEAAERKTPGAKLQRRWSTNTPSAVERWTTQLDEKGRAHKDTEGKGEEEEEGEEAEAVRQAVRRARGRRAKEALMEEATRKAVEEERFLVRQPLEEATRKVVETQAEVRAVAAEAQAAGARAAAAEAEGRVDTAEAQAEARAMRAMAVEAQAAGTLARAAVAEAQRKTVEAKAEAQAEARAVAAEAQARAAEALARAAVAEAQLKTEAAKAETQAEARAMVAEARIAVAEAQARAAVAEARALTAEVEGRIGTLESQASRSSLTPQHPSTSAVQLQQPGMVELGSQAGSAMSELAPRQLGFSAEGTEPDAAAPLAAAESGVGERAQEVARMERAIATARDANLLEPHEIAVRPTRASPARPVTARHCPTQPVGASGGRDGEEWMGCAKGCVVKGAVRHARGRRRRQSSLSASRRWRSRSERSYSPPPPPPALTCWPRKRRRSQRQRQRQWKRKQPRRRQRRRQRSQQQHWP